MRSGDRGDLRARGLEEGALRKSGAAYRRAGNLRQQYVGAVDQRAGPGVPGCAAAALLRDTLLQSAALHAPGRADRAARYATGAPRQARDVPGYHPRQRRGARQGHPEFRREPGRRVLDRLDDGAHRATPTRIRRRRRADRPRDRPRAQRDLPDFRRRRPGHHGARHPDDGRDASRRSMAQVLPAAVVAQGTHRPGSARSEDPGGLLPQGGEGYPGARSGHAELPTVSGRDRSRCRRDPGADDAWRALRSAARPRPSSGPVPVGDLPRSLPLL